MAREFLDVEAGVVHFVNADLIASGLSPLKPELASVQAGKLLLEEIDRLAARVRQGGHNVAKVDVVRRFERGLNNFEQIYRPIADSWVIYDNSKDLPRLIEGSP